MIEINEEYCLYAIKRLLITEKDTAIQGYSDGVFWERNTLKDIKNRNNRKQKSEDELSLFSNIQGGDK